jgi:hypothetical protein
MGLLFSDHSAVKQNHHITRYLQLQYLLTLNATQCFYSIYLNLSRPPKKTPLPRENVFIQI